MPAERRISERFDSVLHLPVTNTDTGELWGHLIDFSHTGMLIMTSKMHHSVGDTIPITVPPVVTNDGFSEHITFEIQATRLIPSARSGYHDIGVRISSIDKKNTLLLKSLLGDICF